MIQTERSCLKHTHSKYFSSHTGAVNSHAGDVLALTLIKAVGEVTILSLPIPWTTGMG